MDQRNSDSGQDKGQRANKGVWEGVAGKRGENPGRNDIAEAKRGVL